MKTFSLTLFALILSISTYAQLSNNVFIGIGRYDFQGHQNFSYKAGFEKKINRTFAIGLSVNYNQEDEIIYYYQDPLSPFEKIKNISQFQGMSYELTIDAYLLGFDNDKFQTHLTLGAGSMNRPKYAFVGYGSLALEERVQFSPKYQLGIGYLFGYDLDQLESLGQGYVCLRRLF